MSSSTSAFELRSEFGSFLYASIDKSVDGGLLNVLSVLARLNLDPWQEAANLARMPRESATRRLASLISTLPGGPSTYQDAEVIAGHLITLLPPGSSSNLALRYFQDLRGNESRRYGGQTQLMEGKHNEDE